MSDQLYFRCLNLKDIEMTIVLHNGDRVAVPNMDVATSFINGIYKDQVERVESKMIYNVAK